MLTHTQLEHTTPTYHTHTHTHTHTHHTHTYTEHKDILNNTIFSLFHGVCDFGRELGVRHYDNSVFDFEGGVGSDETWTAWNGKAPEIVEDESYCGRHSLYVS